MNRCTRESQSGHALHQTAVTKLCVHVPNADFAEAAPADVFGEACPAELAAQLLGRKGLQYREQATLLALCAVHRLLGLPPGTTRRKSEVDPTTAVVVACNLGNVGKVQAIVRTRRSAGSREISPLDAPNASSNVVATSIAIWFKLGGPNLMLCSGSAAGLDAIWAAQWLLRAKRAQRVIVVGTEPDDEVARSLHEQRRVNPAPLRAAAAAILLEQSSGGIADTTLVAPVRRATGTQPPASWKEAAVLAPRAVVPQGIDLSERIGDTYGALGVLQVAVAAAKLEAQGWGAVGVIGGDAVDGWRSTVLSRAAASSDPVATGEDNEHT